MCKLCSFKSLTVENFVTHFRLSHKVSARSLMMCGATDCYAQFHSLERFVQHIKLNHTRPPQGIIQRRNNPVAVTEHWQLSSQDNSADSELLVECPHASCSYKCNSKSTLRSHRFRHHTSAEPLATADNDLSEHIYDEPCSSTFSFSSQGTECQNTQVPHGRGSIANNLDQEETFLKKLVHIYLTLASKFHVPDSTLEFIINDYHLLLKQSLELLGTKLLAELTALGIDCDLVKPVIERVFAQDTLVKLHSDDGPMRSLYMRRQQYTKLFEFVSPISRSLGLNESNKVRKYHYVPIEETLKVFFNNTSVYEQYTERKNREGARSQHVLTDIEDGSLFKKHPVFSSDPSSIQLIIYQDDMEIVNPLGSGKGVYKLTAYYYTLANLHPWSRSIVDPVQLILLCRETDVTYFGLPRVLEPLIEELKKLEDHGIEIRGQNLKVNTLVLLGDNLGTHTVSGFVENFSTAKYFCRYCEERRDEWLSRMHHADYLNNSQSDSDSEASSKGSEISCNGSSTEEEDSENDENQRVPCPIDYETNDEEEVVVEIRRRRNIESDEEVEGRELPFVAPMRTKESYNLCVAELTNQPQGVRGIVADSQFNKLRDYHVVGATPPCLPHDLWEGLGSYDVKLALTYLSKKYKFTIESLNRKLGSFVFAGEDSRDRPPKIGEQSKKLGGHAVQNWVLIRFLPILIGDAITNKQDPVWRMILLLIEILQIICSPNISSTVLPDLHDIIQKYLHLRKTNFPSVRLRPKHHFFEHYPRLISIFGPLMRVSTLRFESKHRYFKTAARSLKNFKNITKSLAMAHQLLQSSLSINNLFNNYPVLQNGVPFCKCVLTDEVSQCVLNTFGREFANTLMCSEKVSYHGTAYEKGKVIVVSSENHPVLDLCQISLVLTQGKSVYAVGKKYEGLLDPELQLYRLKYTGTFTLVFLSKMFFDGIETANSDLDGDVEDCSSKNIRRQNEVEKSTNDLGSAATSKPNNVSTNMSDSDEENEIEESTNNLGNATNSKSNGASTTMPESDGHRTSATDEETIKEDEGMKVVIEKLTPYLQTAEDKGLLLERLLTLGIKTLSDLKFVTNIENDFKGVIKPIQCRRLEAALSQEAADLNESDGSMHHFIDANKLFSVAFITKLTESRSLGNSDRLKFVRTVGDEIYDHFRPVTKKTCRSISASFIKKYPRALSFFKNDEEVAIDNLAEQIQAHAAYNKKLDNKRKSLAEDDLKEDKIRRKKFSVRENFGIDKDMDLPNVLPEDETVNSQKEKQNRMIQMAETGEMNMKLVTQMMMKTYASQRASIARGPNMEDLIKLWPFIGYVRVFKFSILRDHFFTLIPDLDQENIVNRLDEMVPKMLQFLKAETAKTRKGKPGVASNNIMEILKRSGMHQSTKNLQRITMILCLGEIMQQDMTKLFIFFEETTSFDEIQASSKMPDNGKPIVAVLGSDVTKNPKCYVVIEKRCISPEQISPFRAVLLAFMAYFVFKITYPQELSGLLEFLQRAIYNIKADESSKNNSRVERKMSANGVISKNPPAINPRFKKLMKDFEAYCTLWSI